MILANVAQPAKIYELVLLNNIFIQLFWSSFGSLRFFLVEGYLLPLIFKQIRKWNIFNFVSQFGSMFGILSNIQDRGFWTNSGWHLVCDYFQKKLHLRCLANSEFASKACYDLAMFDRTSISDFWQCFEFACNSWYIFKEEKIHTWCIDTWFPGWQEIKSLI